jgi:hypothetical protein
MILVSFCPDKMYVLVRFAVYSDQCMQKRNPAVIAGLGLMYLISAPPFRKTTSQILPQIYDSIFKPW